MVADMVEGQPLKVWKARLRASEKRLKAGTKQPERVRASIERYKRNIEALRGNSEGIKKKVHVKKGDRRDIAEKKREYNRKINREQNEKPSAHPTYDTPFGTAYDFGGNELYIEQVTIRPQYRSWCNQHREFITEIPTAPGSLYFGPIIIEPDEPPPAGFEPFTEVETLCQSNPFRSNPDDPKSTLRSALTLSK